MQRISDKSNNNLAHQSDVTWIDMRPHRLWVATATQTHNCSNWAKFFWFLFLFLFLDSIWKILQRSYTICICHECLPTFEKSAAEANVINTLVQKHDENGGPGSLYLPFTSQVPELLVSTKCVWNANASSGQFQHCLPSSYQLPLKWVSSAIIRAQLDGGKLRKRK